MAGHITFSRWLLVLALLMIWGCDQPLTTEILGDWSRSSDIEGVSRQSATSFTLNDLAYVGNGVTVNGKMLNDWWRYNPASRAWTVAAAFPGVPRSGSVSFAIGGKGYVGLGVNQQGNLLSDFYEYNPDTNAWRRIADFAGTARQGAISFAFNFKGYVGFGDDHADAHDLWSYDPVTNAWQQMVTYQGSGRIGAVAFVMNDRAYIGTGASQGVLLTDWWSYYPALNVWERKRDFPASDARLIQRQYGVGLAIDAKGYLTQGSTTSTVTWEYNPTSDSWKQSAGFEGQNRLNSVGFSLDHKGYISTGSKSNLLFDDLWVFDPLAHR